VYFSIAQGESGASIINRLASLDLIRHSLVARAYLRLRKLDARIKPGGYTLTPALSTPQILNTLTSGPKDIWVTLPEGWRREQIAARLSETFTHFDARLFIDRTATLEGRLFPDTYLLPQDLTVDQAITYLTANFTKKTKLSLADPTLPTTLIVASLLEREAAGTADLPLIAGIILKRLSANWPLQIDATVQYARDTTQCRATPLTCRYWEPLTDTSVVSLYNTYLHPGLPPAPISNPGAAAIQAVLKPQTSPYWYYLHSPDGTVHFGESLADHQANIDKYLQH
jgi:UPF0755 protein